MVAGGKTASTREDVKERAKEMHEKVEAGLIAKLSWLPFLGASREPSADAGATGAGKSILSKTLPNMILIDYLAKADSDSRVIQLRDFCVTVPKNSMANIKMFTPYMVLVKFNDLPFDLACMDDVLADAKGYYELFGEAGGCSKRVLRFNLKAFRNNYGLTDIGRIPLVFHGVLVGQTTEHALGVEAEMSGSMGGTAVKAIELVDGVDVQSDRLLEVYDVILAGVEHIE